MRHSSHSVRLVRKSVYSLLDIIGSAEIQSGFIIGPSGLGGNQDLLVLHEHIQREALNSQPIGGVS